MDVTEIDLDPELGEQICQLFEIHGRGYVITFQEHPDLMADLAMSLPNQLNAAAITGGNDPLVEFSLAERKD
jgi:hypothetical protein